MFLCYSDAAHMSYFGWENEALPLGNGRIGAKVFGGKECELIHFNEKTLWSGGAAVEGFKGGIRNTDKGKAFREIQELLNNGNVSAATARMKELEGDSTGFGAYQSFGNLYIQFEHKGDFQSYVRDLDLDTASSMVTYRLDKTTYTRHYFVSYPDNVFVARLEKETKHSEDEKQPEADPKISFEAYVVSEQKGESKSEGDTIYLSGTVKANEGLDGEDGKDKNNMKYGCAVRFITQGGEVTAVEGGKIKVTDAESVVIIMSLATDYVNTYPVFSDGSDPLKKAVDFVDKAAERSFAELYRRHLDDYKALYNRVSFNLGEQEIKYSTDYMLKRFDKKKEYKRNLITLLFQYGRYLLISSSRDGSLPANLQGIWNAKNNPPWSCDYHFNINVQMNYWAAYAANLCETALPYIDFVNSLKKPGRLVAYNTLGIGDGDFEKATGWMIHTMVTPLGFVGPGWDWKWGWAPTNGAWATQNMFDYYLYTLDIQKLKNDIYPTMEECALMWTQLLVRDKKSGRLTVSPGFSPEHGPVSAGNTYDQSIIYNLYEDVIAASQALTENGYETAVNKELIATIKEQIKELRPIHIGKWGQIKEWYDEDKFLMRGFYTKSVQKKHRHLSHLLSLYPFRQIDADDPKMLKAALTSLDDRGKKSTGWGLAVRLLSYARLRQGNDCDEIIENIISTAILKNLFGTHPPFQIDGNFGLVAGICEMLMQSHKAYIHLLPALPENWKEGEIKGLLARGNFEISMKWTVGKLKEGTVKSNSGGKCSLKYDGKIMLVYDEDGNEIETEFIDGITTFQTEKGKTYKIS
ncbi:MAG: glycoside hydrolase family 95 protein [Clostridia bacterium]|nr:glycoside hydrolase family 95 protein [Clostridia bacterium]